MTEDDLISAGYRRYHSGALTSTADAFYQKTVRSSDRSKKLYFINFSMWDFSKFDRFPKDQDPIRFEADAHLYRSRDRSYRLAIPVESGDTIEDIEWEFARAHDGLGCVPDVHNNDGD